RVGCLWRRPLAAPRPRRRWQRCADRPHLAAARCGPGAHIWVSEQWPRRVIRPTASPLRELAMHLADVAGVDPVSVYRSMSAAPDEAPTLVEVASRTVTGRGSR